MRTIDLEASRRRRRRSTLAAAVILGLAAFASACSEPSPWDVEDELDAGAAGLESFDPELDLEPPPGWKVPEQLVAPLPPALPEGDPEPTPSAPQRTPRAAPALDALPPSLAESIAALRGADAGAAERAFWKLTDAPAEQIPHLIELVESRDPTPLAVLKLLVIDDSFQGFYASHIPGMGVMEREDAEGNIVWRGYTGRLACGIARNKKGKQVVLRLNGGFPLGVVARAILVNRFARVAVEQNSRPAYPAGIAHTVDLAGWWMAYYRNSFGR